MKPHSSDISRNTMATDPAKVIAKLETLCVSAERCTYELRERLYRWKIYGEEADKIIDSLTKRGFVNDERFVRAFVNDKSRFDRWGQRKIAVALSRKKISSKLYSSILQEIDSDFVMANINYLLQLKSKSAGYDISTFEGRTKLYRYVVSRGFYPSDASVALRDFLKSSDV